MIMELKIGDRVSTTLCSSHGRIVDILTATGGRKLYTIHFDGDTEPSRFIFTESEITKEPSVEYKWEFEVLENVVVGIMYEVIGDQKTEVARGHGHLIHEGRVGVAQAASYALKKAYENLNNGSIYLDKN